MTESTETKKQLYGTALLKGKSIIDYIAHHTDGVSLKELSENLPISKPTILKLLQTLEYCDFVRDDHNEDRKKYFIGTLFLDYGQIAASSFKIKDYARPYLDQLKDITNETVNLGIVEHGNIVLLDKLESPRSIKLVSQVGRDLHMYCSAMGKAILANYSDEKLNTYLDKTELHSMTPNTITDPDELRKNINEVREQGYSIDDIENQAEIFCVGFSLIKNNNVYGAFSISAPDYRVSQKELTLFIREGLKTQKAILEKLP